ncbi:hypothetical protein [Halobacterium yunchengense]|uniref:hypothetical protein n=1 Tax=Halobacterium yunchengense TaxID=3108497 RepID=UPI00300A28F4
MRDVFADSLDAYGVLVAAFLVLVGVGTLVGMPWQHSNSAAVTVLQVAGALATAAVGTGLGWLVHTQ